MDTLLISLACYRSTLIFRCTLAKHRCYLLNVAAVYSMLLLFIKYRRYLTNVALFIKYRRYLINVAAIY